MMQDFELIGVMPATQTAPPHPELLFETTGAFTVILQRRHMPSPFLPHRKKRIILETAKRQSLLETCMITGPVLVVKPGTSLLPEQVPLFIAANADLFARLTAQFDRMVQFQITVAWDEARVLERFRLAPELARLFQKDTVSKADIQSCIAQLTGSLRTRISHELSDVADDLIALPVAEDIIYNGVLMVSSNRQNALDDAVEAIDAIWTDGFQIKQIGPAPVASFALLDPQIVTPDHLVRAYTLLGLSEGPSQAEIDAARRSALLHAPQSAQSISDAARNLTAAANLGDLPAGFLLCNVLSEATSASQFQQAVA